MRSVSHSIITQVEDNQAWIPDGHRKGQQPTGPLPSSLVDAIDAFVISTAVRRARQRDHGVTAGHSTMLVHVTRWTDVQGTVARQIEEHLRSMADAWGDRGASGRDLHRRLRAFWDNDYEPTYAILAGGTTSAPASARRSPGRVSSRLSRMSLKKRPTASSGSMEPRTTFWTTSRPRRSRWWRSAARNSTGASPSTA